MAFTVTEWFKKDFSNVVHMLAQQGQSRLLRTVREEGVDGEAKFVDRLGTSEMVERTSRHSDTPLVDTPHSRRRLNISDFEWADLIDQQDKVKTLNDPTNPYTMEAGAAKGRKIDDVIIAAATGTALTGKEGTGSETWPVAGQQIVHGGTNLSLTKIRQAKKILDANEVPENDRFFIYTAAGLESLLNQTQVTSSDFNTIKALVMGDLNTYLGFEFIRSQRLTKAGNIVSGLAYQREALRFGRNPLNEQVEIDRRSDKSYSTQVYIACSIGSVRVEAARIVEVQYDDTAALAT